MENGALHFGKIYLNEDVLNGGYSMFSAKRESSKCICKISQHIINFVIIGEAYNPW